MCRCVGSRIPHTSQVFFYLFFLVLMTTNCRLSLTSIHFHVTRTTCHIMKGSHAVVGALFDESTSSAACEPPTWPRCRHQWTPALHAAISGDCNMSRGCEMNKSIWPRWMTSISVLRLLCVLGFPLKLQHPVLLREPVYWNHLVILPSRLEVKLLAK